MLVTDIEHDGVRATIEYHQYSYIARLYRVGHTQAFAVQVFGNGVYAEDWILKELKWPTSLLVIKHLKE